MERAMTRFALVCLTLSLSTAAAFADVAVTGELGKDYMKGYCLYESHLYSVGSDMCSADGHVQVCTADEKGTSLPVWKTDKRTCNVSGE
jgi:hypothetical protein